jgi:hypothetical protein
MPIAANCSANESGRSHRKNFGRTGRAGLTIAR